MTSLIIPWNPFPFLDLPGEVRNQIYILLLTAKYRPGVKESYSGRQPGLSAAILRVSRLLYAECNAFLYSLNVFQAHPSLLSYRPFLTEISRPVVSPLNSALICRYYIEVRLDSDPFWTGYDLKKAFSGIRELHVVSWQASYGTCGMDNLFPFVHVRRVGKAVVEGSNVPPDFARWLEGVMMSQEGDDLATHGLPDLPEYNVWDNGDR
jgi:hypothetical protein